MKTNSSLGFYGRILLAGIFIAVLGLGPAPHAVSSMMVNAYQSAKVGDYQNAAQDLANVIQFYPTRLELNLEAAHYAFQANDAKATIQYFEHPGMANLLTADDLVLLGDAYKQSGNPGRAEAIWRGVADGGKSEQALQRLVDTYLEQKDYASAAENLQKLLSLSPSERRLYYEVGLLYAAIDPLKALPYLSQAADIDPTHAPAARELYDKIRTANLFDQPAYIYLASGRQLAGMGEWDLASEAFKQAVDLDSGYAEAWAFLGESRQQTAKYETGTDSDDGLAELQKALQLDGSSVLAHTFMGLYWERRQDYPQAQQYMEQAIALNPKDPYLFSELGNILSRSGDLPAAQAAFESAIRLTPKDPVFYRLLANFSLENQIQIRELALPAARQAVLLAPRDANSLDVMAQVMLMLHDYHSAESYAAMALESDPRYAPATLHLGTAYLYLGEPDLARQWLTSAGKIGSGSWVSDQATRMLEYYFP